MFKGIALTLTVAALMAAHPASAEDLMFETMDPEPIAQLLDPVPDDNHVTMTRAQFNAWNQELAHLPDNYVVPPGTSIVWKSTKPVES